jgi:HD superfamily phosphohydrolase
VAEGVINYERLLNMLNVVDDGLVIEAKGIYSVEKFITARRLMYWQVYLHKTVLAAEYMLMKILQRAKELAAMGRTPVASPALRYFLEKEKTATDNKDTDEMIRWFAQLDDYDIQWALKAWKNNSDKPLSYLASGIVDRRLLRIEIQKDQFDENYLNKISEKTRKKLGLEDNEVDYFVFHDKTSNYAYFPGPDRINILYKDGSVKDISEASDDLNISLLKKPTVKHFLCYPKHI